MKYKISICFQSPLIFSPSLLPDSFIYTLNLFLSISVKGGVENCVRKLNKTIEDHEPVSEKLNHVNSLRQ